MTDTIEVKPLPLSVKKNGLEYTLYKKGKVSAIYEVKADGIIVAYETTKIKVTTAREVFGVFYPAFETFPGNETFGTLAWCCGLCGGDAEAALERCETLYFNKLEDGTFSSSDEHSDDIVQDTNTTATTGKKKLTKSI